MGLDTAAFLLFLFCIAALQALMPGRGRMMTLLVASLAFYAMSSVSSLILLLLLCGINYWATSSLSQQSEERRRTWIFGSTVVINLAVLIFFKQASDLIGRFLPQGQNSGIFAIAAPLGLSYFTFQMLACVTDAYRQTWKLEHGFAQFVLFGFFFPQISSGPIPRAQGLLPQLLTGGRPVAEDRLAGLRLIAYGFFKKFVVANNLNEYVTSVFKGSGNGTFPTFVACCLNALQLYADFSGYVDIALGSARFIGIRLDPNFDRPFSSTSVTEFWRRWHMTLSFWLRDYLYMPLVIRLRNLGKFGIALTLIGIFAICGLWHGATWTFLLFGLSQGIVLAAETLSKPWRTKNLKQIPKRVIVLAGSVYTLGFFVLSQVLFRSHDLSEAQGIYTRLFHFQIPRGINAMLGAGPFVFALTAAAMAAWIGTVFFYRRTSDRSTPWFLMLCATFILFLGRMGSGHFIYAAF